MVLRLLRAVVLASARAIVAELDRKPTNADRELSHSPLPVAPVPTFMQPAAEPHQARFICSCGAVTYPHPGEIEGGTGIQCSRCSEWLTRPRIGHAESAITIPHDLAPPTGQYEEQQGDWADYVREQEHLRRTNPRDPRVDPDYPKYRAQMRQSGTKL